MMSAKNANDKLPLLKILLLALLAFIAMFNLTLIAPVLPEFVMARFDVGPDKAAWFVTLEMVAYIIFAPIWGSISDKIGNRKVFIGIGFAGSALMYALMAIPSNLYLLLGMRFIQGSITVMAWSLVMTSALDIAPKKKYGVTMGILGSGMMLGNAFGAPIGGMVFEIFGMFAPLYLASGLFSLGAVLTILLLKEQVVIKRSKSMLNSFKVLLEEKRLAIPYAYGFADRFTVGFFILVLPAYMSEVHNASPGTIGMFMGLLLFPFALFQFPAGLLSDKIGRWKPLALGSLCYGVGMCFIGIVAPWALVPLMIILGILAALMFPPSVALTGDLAPSDKRGTAMGGISYKLFRKFHNRWSIGDTCGRDNVAVLIEISEEHEER